MAMGSDEGDDEARGGFAAHDGMGRAWRNGTDLRMVCGDLGVTAKFPVRWSIRLVIYITVPEHPASGTGELGAECRACCRMMGRDDLFLGAVGGGSRVVADRRNSGLAGVCAGFDAARSA